jgi:hypothetical protein
MAANSNNIIIGAASITVDGTDLGFTKGGTSVRYEQEQIDIIADQAVGVVRKARSLERMYVKTTMLEMTLSNLRKAFMLPAASLVGNTLTLGYNNSCWVDEVVIVLVGSSPSCGTRTFTFSKCVTFGEREYMMTRDAETAFEVEFECLKDSNGHFGTVVDS